jgi:hypothetical protein
MDFLKTEMTRAKFLRQVSIAAGVAAAAALPAGVAEAQVSAPTLAQQVQRITDEMDIRRIIEGIAFYVDQKDWKMVRSFWTPDINVDFTSLAGGQPARIKADDLVKSWETNLHKEKQSFHLYSMHMVTVNGNKAEAMSKGYAYNMVPNRLPVGGGSEIWEVFGTYTHTFDRTAQGWRATSIRFNAEYSRGNQGALTFMP